MNIKNSILSGSLLAMVMFAKYLYAEPRVIVVNAYMVNKAIILSDLSVSWTTIESNAPYPTGLHPYSEGYRYYGPALQGREYYDSSETDHRDYWDTLFGFGRTMITIQPEDTWVTLAEKYGKAVGKNGTGAWSHYTPSQYYSLVRSCTVVSRLSVQTTYDDSDVMIDPASCSNIPQVPDPAKCDLEMVGSNIIDHGTLLDTEVNGNTKTATVTLRCTKPAAVEFRLLDHPVELGNGITSTVTIEGSESPVITVNDFKNINIESRLSALNPIAGRFTGNVVLIANLK